MRKGIVSVFLLADATALFCIVNPWFEEWSAQRAVFFLLEALFFFVGVPVFLHQVLPKGKTRR